MAEISGYETFFSLPAQIAFGLLLICSIPVYLVLILKARAKIRRMQNELNYMSYCVLSCYLLRCVQVLMGQCICINVLRIIFNFLGNGWHDFVHEHYAVSDLFYTI